MAPTPAVEVDKARSLSDVVNSRWEVLRHETEKLESDLLEGYRARIDSGLLDEKKLKRYAELRRQACEAVPKEAPAVEGERSYTRFRQRRLIRQALLSGEPAPIFTVAWDGHANSWGVLSTPAEHAYAKHGHELDVDRNLLRCDLETSGGWEPSTPAAQSFGCGVLVFKIPGQYVSYGIVEITPFVELDGWGRVWGDFFDPSCQATAWINVSTRLNQDIQGVPVPGAKELSPFGKPVYLVEHKWPGNPFPWHVEVPGTGGLPAVDFSAEVPAAGSSGFADGGLDLYVEVAIAMQCWSLGPWAGSELHVEAKVPYVKMTWREITADVSARAGELARKLFGVYDLKK